MKHLTSEDESGGILCNQAGSTVIVQNSTFLDVASDQKGGAIGVSNSILLEINDTVFDSCRVDISRCGGAVFASNTAEVRSFRNIFVGNTAGDGSCICVTDGSSSLISSFDAFIRNWAEGEAAIYYDSFGSPKMSNNSFCLNAAQSSENTIPESLSTDCELNGGCTIDLTSCCPSGFDLYRYDSIQVDCFSLKVYSSPAGSQDCLSLLTTCSLQSAYSAVFFTGKIYLTSGVYNNGSLTINKPISITGHSGNPHDVVFDTQTINVGQLNNQISGPVTIKSIKFLNSPQMDVWMDDNLFSLINVVFSGCTGSSSLQFGTPATVLIDGALFKNANQVISSTQVFHLTMNSSSIVGFDQGGIFSNHSDSSMVFTNCFFSSISSHALFAFETLVHVNDSTFDNCSTSAIRAMSATLLLSRSVFTNCISDSSGSALFLTNTTLLSVGNTYSSNHAADKAAIYEELGSSSALSNDVFCFNTAVTSDPNTYPSTLASDCITCTIDEDVCCEDLLKECIRQGSNDVFCRCIVEALDGNCITECPIGQYEADQKCHSCDPGQYQPLPDQIECIDCPEGSSTLSVSPKTEIGNCLCIIGYYGPPASCNLCPVGGICDQVDQRWPRPAPGYWSDGSSDVMLSCSPASYCTGNGDCASGRTGRMCVECKPRHFPNGDICEPCPAPNPLYFPLLILALILICILLIVVRGSSSPAIRIALNWGQVVALLPAFHVQWPAIVLTFFSYLQMLGLNIDVLRPECQVTITWQDKWILQLLAPFGFALVFFFIYLVARFHSMIGTRWISKSVKKGREIKQWLADPPDEAINRMRAELSVTEAEQIRAVFDRWDTEKTGELGWTQLVKAVEAAEAKAPSIAELEQIIKALDVDHDGLIQWPEFEQWAIARIIQRSGWRRLVSSLVFGLSDEDLRDLPYQCQGGFVQFLWLAYLTLGQRSIELFDCTAQSDGTSTLDVYPLMNCYSLEWFQLLPIAIAALIVYVIGIPLLFTFVLVHGRNHLRSKPVELRFGSLFRHYRLNPIKGKKWPMPTFWWELIVFIRKLVILLLALFLTTYPTEQTILTMVFLGVFLLISAGFLPYRYNRDNVLEVVMLAQSILVYGCGIVFLSTDNELKETKSDEKKREIESVIQSWTIVLFAATGVGLVAIVFVLYRDIAAWRSRQQGGITRRIREIKVTRHEKQAKRRTKASMMKRVVKEDDEEYMRMHNESTAQLIVGTELTNVVQPPQLVAKEEEFVEVDTLEMGDDAEKIADELAKDGMIEES